MIKVARLRLISSSPRMQYHKINGRKVNRWRYELGQQFGINPNNSIRLKEGSTGLYKLDSSMNNMTTRIAQQLERQSFLLKKYKGEEGNLSGQRVKTMKHRMSIEVSQQIINFITGEAKATK